MKWCFLVNNFQFMPQFFGKLAAEILEAGDECLVVFSSKVAEYDKKKYFPAGTKFISVVDWNMEHFKKDKKDFPGLSWKDFFPFWERNPVLNLDYQTSIEITSQITQFYEFLFDTEKPDVIINEVPTGLAHLVAYNLCQTYNSVYLALGNSRLHDCLDVYDKKFTFSGYKKAFDSISDSSLTQVQKESAQKMIKKFTTHEVVLSFKDPSKIYFSQFGLIKHFLKRLKETYTSFLPYLFERSKYKAFDSESEIATKLFFRAFLNAQKRKARIFLHQHFFKEALKDGEKFFLFPLHYQPEASTNVYATYYCDQVATAKNMAFSLPFPYKLYVKEHPGAVGTRKEGFYQELKKIPNIVLIPPEVSMETMIKNSAGLVVLTGTAGLEAALLGKPVYVLGDVFYVYHPMCREIKGFEELKNSIEKDIIKKPNIGALESWNNRFIASYIENTIAGNTNVASVGKDTNNYKVMYQDLVKILSGLK